MLSIATNFRLFSSLPKKSSLFRSLLNSWQSKIYWLYMPLLILDSTYKLKLHTGLFVWFLSLSIFWRFIYFIVYIISLLLAQFVLTAMKLFCILLTLYITESLLVMYMFLRFFKILIIATESRIEVSFLQFIKISQVLLSLLCMDSIKYLSANVVKCLLKLSCWFINNHKH